MLWLVRAFGTTVLCVIHGWGLGVFEGEGMSGAFSGLG